jgi:hypothetical protein
MVLRAGQRRQDEELEDVERQLFLDDLHVAQDGLARVAGKTEDIARRRAATASSTPREQPSGRL